MVPPLHGILRCAAEQPYAIQLRSVDFANMKLAQCSAATNHLITNAVINISSDIMIILIPMPLLFKVKIPTKNKAILFGVFLIGTFTVGRISWQ